MAAYPHIEWLDLRRNGVLTECAVMKRDANGNIYYFPVTTLDNVDKTRLRNILTSRNARNYPLWDLMNQVTLGNGVNALEYFHQLVKVLTPSGTIMDPVVGMMGARLAQPQVQAPVQQAAAVAQAAPQVLAESAPVAGEKDTRTPAQKRKDTIAAKQSAE